nr:hypothetical protein BaRGS_030623 [Batillaria attramentaria]
MSADERRESEEEKAGPSRSRGNAVKALKEAEEYNELHPVICTMPPLPPIIDISEKHKIANNYKYMKHQIMSAPISPLQQCAVDRIKSFIPEHLQTPPALKKVLDELFQEVHKLFHESMQKSNGKLHLVHPAMRTLLNMCQVELGNLVLADCSKYRGDSTLEYDSWKNSVSLELEKSEEKLMQSWFPDVVALFSDKKQLNLPHGKSTSFFNSVNTLISNQLMDMKVRTIEHYAELFEHDNRLKLPVLRIELVLDEGVMTFYPPVTDFEQLVSSIMYMMAKTMIDKYEYLINGTALAEVEKFLSEKHEFEEYTERIDYYRKVAMEINSLPSVAFYDTFRLDCDDLKLGLVEAARGLANKLLMRVVDDHRRANKKTIDGFEEIKRRALHVPETNENCHQEAYTRLKYLMDVHLFTADDIQLQTEVFNWPVLIDPVFDQHEVLAEKSKHQNEVLLAEKTKKVHREIEKLKQRMDEFNDFGELDMIQQYIKDVMAVQRRIDAVQELIEWINKVGN